MRIVSGVLILITAFLSFKHGWDGLMMNIKAGEPDLMAELGIGKAMGYVLSIVSVAIGVMVLIPQTFFLGNLLNASVILLIMAMSLRVGNLKIAFMEIPFFLMPLLLIYLGHPFKK